MAVWVNPEFAIKGAEAVDHRLLGIKNGLAKAASGAINDILKQARTDLVRGIAKEIKVKLASVRNRVSIVQTKADSLEGYVYLRASKRPGLMSFGARQNKNGVSYRIATRGGRKTIKSAFIAKGRGHKDRHGDPGEQLSVLRVFKRRYDDMRLPLDDLKGPSLNAVVNKNKIDRAVKKTIEQKLPDRIAARIKLLIERGK